MHRQPERKKIAEVVQTRSCCAWSRLDPARWFAASSTILVTTDANNTLLSSPRSLTESIQALACGTPVVTAGALQSVHRLAEGLIAAAANTQCQGREEHPPEEHKGEVGAFKTTLSGRSTDGCVDLARGGQQTAGGAPAGGAAENCRETTTKYPDVTSTDEGSDECVPTTRHHWREGERKSPGAAAGTASASDAAVNTDDDNDDDDEQHMDNNVLVRSLVARSTTEYIAKAIAVAAPGALKRKVRRALRCGRNSLLHGGGEGGGEDGSDVAADWERFLTNAAASATAANSLARSV